MRAVSVTRFIDDDGTVCVQVPLTNDDRSVILYQDDFNKLISMGIDVRWRISLNQILERGRARICITRLIMDAGEGDKIQFLDRNHCNLRRQNLVVCPGGGRHPKEDRLDPAKRLPNKYLNKVEIKFIDVLPSWERAQ